MKILTPVSGDFLKYAATENAYKDGRFTIMEKESDKPYTGRIDMNTDYDLVVFIQDGGDFDLDNKTNGYVVDPVVLVRKTWSGQEDDGGGCSAGYGGSISLLLIGLALFSVNRKKR
jgi:hypothetical protein